MSICDDWRLFYSLDTLGQKAGVVISDLVAVAAKELVDNALDACPNGCRVGLLEGENGFFVEDEGSGIEPRDGFLEFHLARLFSVNRPLMSSKRLRKPTRGALGNGLRVVAGLVYCSGPGGEIRVMTKGESVILVPGEDGSTEAVDWSPSDRQVGTRIEIRLGANLEVSEYDLRLAEFAITLARGGPDYRGKSSLHWYSPESFADFCQTLDENADTSVRGFLVENFVGCSGPKAGEIVEVADLKGRTMQELSRDEAIGLHNAAMLLTTKKVRADNLGLIGPNPPGLPGDYASFCGEYNLCSPGMADLELPCAVEAWAEPSLDSKDRFSLSVNRTLAIASLYAERAKSTITLSGCRLHHTVKAGKGKYAIHVNIQIPFVPKINDGKAPDLEPIGDLIAKAVDKAIKKAQKSAPKLTRGQKSSQKQSIIESLPEAIKKAGGNGTHFFSLRQLFYVVRPIVAAIHGNLEYKTFTSVITGYELHEAEIPNMCRDNRGIIYHPHTGEEIPLGTLSVARYKRPRLRFNKVLYCEKEGVVAILRHAGWPEANDCAIMTSKGFPTRAVRHLIDMMTESDKTLQIFCLHDADASGTMIYQSLLKATAACPGRKVEIINLGLDPAKAIEMGLPEEALPKKDKKKRQPVADYITDEDTQEWLQHHRIELNAMTTEQLLEYLTAELAKHVKPEQRKLIPTDDVVAAQLRQYTRDSLLQSITERVIRDAGVDQQVEKAMADLDSVLREREAQIRSEVKSSLKTNATQSWYAPVARAADEIATKHCA